MLLILRPVLILALLCLFVFLFSSLTFSPFLQVDMNYWILFQCTHFLSKDTPFVSKVLTFRAIFHIGMLLGNWVKLKRRFNIHLKYTCNKEPVSLTCMFLDFWRKHECTCFYVHFYSLVWLFIRFRFIVFLLGKKNAGEKEQAWIICCSNAIFCRHMPETSAQKWPECKHLHPTAGDSGTVLNTITGAWLLDRLPHEADDWSHAEVRQRGRQIGSLGEKGERFRVGHLGRR